MTTDHPIIETIARLNGMALYIEIEGDPSASGQWIGARLFDGRRNNNRNGSGRHRLHGKEDDHD